MLQRFVTMVSFVFSCYLLYKYRYRVINAFLGKRWLRKVAISMAMQIPTVRDKVLGSVLSNRQPQHQ
ncbi:sodium:proton antiporter [Alkalihalobacillus oceani]|uniref:sodium:proton antiporter n=1 Tax=Halalkalibacter oceani TaxID=1653776 RepID=UPI00203B6222|nr:sodium:proton antiporter [Halalkalibacter oceani]MCM3761654.1 sodium:proton antiporter [Halalkalibacter oceani]